MSIEHFEKLIYLSVAVTNTFSSDFAQFTTDLLTCSIV